MFSLEPRPPYVEFHRTVVERKDAAGQMLYVDTDEVWITPQGSKDRVIKAVPDWFANLEMQVRDGERFPKKWFDGYKEAYAAWQSGQEMPVDGTPLRNWPVITEAELKLLLDLHLRTVEDLALATEEALRRMGMGGRSLKQRAQDWLTAKQGDGSLVLQLDAMRVSMRALEDRNKVLQDKVTTLEAQLSFASQRVGGDNPALPSLESRLAAAREAVGADLDDVLN